MHRTLLALLSGLSLLPVLAAQDRAPLKVRGSGLQVTEPDARDLDLRMTPVVKAVQKSADSVVSIYINHQARREVVTDGQGSGVILDESGFVITNWHVIAPVALGDGYQLAVKLKDGRSRAARLLSSSAKHDLALLQIQLEGDEKVKPVEIGRSADLMVGETTIAIGNPQGHANTVTSGVLSATGRSIQVRTPDGEVRSYSGLLQTDAAINQGNSGGALLDITGKLIGINNAMAQGAENIGFAIPVDTVREVFEKELIQSDSFANSTDAAWLGLAVGERDGEVVVSDVTADGPAARAGVQKGDVLARVGESEVRTSLDYMRRVINAPADKPLPLQLRRDRKLVEAAPVPMTRTAWTILEATGLDLQEIAANDDTALVRKVTLELSRESHSRQPVLPVALRVQHVQLGSPAAELQFQPGDSIVTVIGRDGFGRSVTVRIESARQLASILRQNGGRTLEIVVLRGDESLSGRLDIRRLTR